MLRASNILRRLMPSSTPHRLLHTPASAHALSTAASASSTTAPSHPSVITAANAQYPPQPPLQPWSGADVEMILHDSFETMVPVDVVPLPGILFNAPVRPDLVHRVVHWQLAKRRQGTHKAKTRSEVAGSGRKIRPQKGGGQSRHGDIRSPIFRGGGRVHGPVPRDYFYPLPFNVRRNALRSALTSKFLNGQLWLVRSADISDARTQTVVNSMDAHGWRSALLVDDVQEGGTSGVPTSLHSAAANIRNTIPINALGLNVYHAITFDQLVITTAALDHLRKRFEKYEWLF